MFDVSYAKSFENLDFWMKEFFGTKPQGPIPCIICGNKIDQPDRVISKQVPFPSPVVFPFNMFI